MRDYNTVHFKSYNIVIVSNRLDKTERYRRQKARISRFGGNGTDGNNQTDKGEDDNRQGLIRYFKIVQYLILTISQEYFWQLAGWLILLRLS